MSNTLMDTTKFSASHFDAKEILDPSDRIHKFGVECKGPAGDGIVFRAGTWRPGGEYIQKLIVRNVSTSVKKLKYRLPSTRYFSLAYPEVIVLSPGVSKEIDVIFRPVEFEPYDDTIYFKMQEGPGSEGFHVPVRAMIDKLIVDAPEGIDMGYCTTHQLTTITFKMINSGEIDAPFSWDPPFPFQFEPREGVIGVGHSIDIKVHLRPEEAITFVAQAICTVGQGVHAIIPRPVFSLKLSAIGKYGHISLSDSFLNFGEVLTGTDPRSNPLDVVLRNSSVVPVEFQLFREDTDRSCYVFQLTPAWGIIPPLGETPITVYYSALAAGTFSLDRFVFRTPGGWEVPLTCQGHSVSPKIRLFRDLPPKKPQPHGLTLATNSMESMEDGRQEGHTLSLTSTSSTTSGVQDGAPMNSLNFRDVELGRKITAVFYLSNESDGEVHFSIFTDSQGIFQVEPCQGVLGPHLSQFAIRIHFEPQHPINYYRRLFILISDSLPLFVDVMGTGFIRAKGEIKEFRPAPIRPAHIQAFRNRVVAGWGRWAPEELDLLFEQLLHGNLAITSSDFMENTELATTSPVHSPFLGMYSDPSSLPSPTNLSSSPPGSPSQSMSSSKRLPLASTLPPLSSLLPSLTYGAGAGAGAPMSGTSQTNHNSSPPFLFSFTDLFAQVGPQGTRPLARTTTTGGVPQPLTRTGDSTRPALAIAQEFFLEFTSNRTLNGTAATTSSTNVGGGGGGVGGPSGMIRMESTSGKTRKWELVYPFDEVGHYRPEISVNENFLDFGFTSFHATSDRKYVTLTNHTRGKVTVQWEVPPVEGGGSSNSSNGMTASTTPSRRVFQVDPALTDLLPGQSVNFQVTFQPFQSDRHFSCQLEAYIFFKNQRSFRLVNDATLSPPWCIPISCQGHSFGTGQLLAKARIVGSNLQQGKLEFPTTFVQDCLFQTLILKNTSNLPATFRIHLGFEDEVSGSSMPMKKSPFPSSASNTSSNSPFSVFTVKPSFGEIQASSEVVLCVRFQPDSCRKFLEVLRVFVNGTETCKVLLEGSGGLPFLLFPDLKSPSDLALASPLGPPQAGSPSFQTPFSQGGASTASLTSIFPPTTHRGLRGPLSPPEIPRGPQGLYFFPPTCVGLSVTRPFRIRNGSRLPLRFQVVMPPDCEGVFQVAPEKGLLKGNESLTLQVTFMPREAVRQEWKVKFQIYSIGGQGNPVLSLAATLASGKSLLTLPSKGKGGGAGVLALPPPSNFVMDGRQPGYGGPAEVLQSLSVTFVTPGEIAALAFHPSTLTFPVSLVNTCRHESLYLENIADSDLSYRLFYSLTFQPDSAQIIEINREFHDFQPLIREESGANPDRRNLEHHIFCEEPQGILSARSKKRITFSFYPMKSGAFEFRIAARLKSVRHPFTDEAQELWNEKVMELRLYGNDQGKNQQGSRESIMVPLAATLQARAAYPRILVEDLRVLEDSCLVANVESLWKQYSLTSLNHDLGLPLTEAENRLFQTSSPNLSLFPRYSFRFTPVVYGSPLQSLQFSLRNDGYLPTKFHFHFPNEKELELEAWCDEEDPSEEQNMLISILEELKSFSMSPKSGLLEPGQACSITVSYRPHSLKYGGYHRLPVHVRIDHGKQFFLDFIGRTLPSSTTSYPSSSTSAAAGISVTLGGTTNNATGMLNSTSLVPMGGGGGAIVTPMNQGPSMSMSTAPPTAPSAPPGTSGSSTMNPPTTAAAAAAARVPPSASPTYNPFNYEVKDYLLWVSSDLHNRIILSPVPLGLTASTCPRQRIELINVSSLPLLYQVDTSSLHDFMLDNFNQPLFSLSNPQGTIPPYSFHYLDVYFYPLVAKKYTLNLVVKYSPLRHGMWDGNGNNNNSSIISGGANNNNNNNNHSHSLTAMNSNNNNNNGSTPSLGTPMSRNTSFLVPGSRGGGGGSLLGPPSSRPSGIAGRNSGTSMTSRNGTANSSRMGTGLSRNNGNSNSSNNNMMMMMNLEESKLEFQVECWGYNPQFYRPKHEEELIRGGRPPQRPLLTIPQQWWRISNDLCSYDIIPEHSEVHRLVRLSNLSETLSLEFIVDDSWSGSSILLHQGILSVQPSFGRLEPKEEILLNIKIHAECEPWLLSGEKIGLRLRQVVRPSTQKSRGGVSAKLLEKIRKKPSTADHESIVSRPTSSRSTYLENTMTPLGKDSVMPSTFTSKGDFSPPSKHRHGGGFASSSTLNNGTTMGNTTNNVNTTTATTNNLSSNLLLEDSQNFGENLSTFSPGGGRRGTTMTPAGGISTTSPTSRGGSTFRTGTSQSGLGGTSLSSGNNNNNNNKTLLGASEMMIIRLSGCILRIEDIETLFPNLPLTWEWNLLDGQGKTTDQCWNWKWKSGNGDNATLIQQSQPQQPSSSSDKAMVSKVLRIEQGKQEFLSHIESELQGKVASLHEVVIESSSILKEVILPPGPAFIPPVIRSNGLTNSMNHATENGNNSNGNNNAGKSKILINANIPVSREWELRSVSEFILENLWSKLITAGDMKDYLKRSVLLEEIDVSQPALTGVDSQCPLVLATLPKSQAHEVALPFNSDKKLFFSPSSLSTAVVATDAADAAVPVPSMLGDVSTASSPVAPEKLRGLTTVGVFFEEIKGKLTLVEQFFRELYFGGLLEPPTLTSSSLSTSSTSSSSSSLDSEASKLFHVSNEKLWLRDASVTSMTAEKLKEACTFLSISTKGAAFKSMEER